LPFNSVPNHFGRIEVFEILQENYGKLAEKTAIKLNKAATGKKNSF
jgi:hypothetical protein